MKTAFLILVMIVVSMSVTAQVGTDGFRGIHLGMSLEAVKDGLLADPYFDYRGDPDVSFLPLSRQSLIECEGNAYVSRGYFQFHEGSLYIITLLLSQEQLDHYSLFTTLTARYGPHNRLNPDRIVWEFDHVDLALERPLTVKYIDRDVFDTIQDEGVAGEQLENVSRNRFLELF